MRGLKVAGLIALALLAVASLTATSAFAEDPNSPSVLLLEGKSSKKGSELEGKESGAAASLATLAGKEALATSSEASLRGCESISGHEFDVNLCKDVVLTLKGVKKEKVACRSETKAGEKDAVETVLALLDLHLASEESLEAGETMELQPLGLGKVLSAALEGELFVNCGGIKEVGKGVVGCLVLPGLRNLLTTEKGKIVCSYSTTTHDPITGHCVQSCEWLEKEPLLVTLGAGFEDGWLSFSVEGSVNEHVFVDD